MDPHAVRVLGGDLRRLGTRATGVARQLEGLGLAPTGDGLGLGRETTSALAVWADGTLALGTELGLLGERCEASARGVEAEDERARHRFVPPAGHRGGS